MIASEAEKIAAGIVALFKEKGKANYSGEKITQLEHASQAAQLAEKDGNDSEVILAAFMHDIGHLLDDAPGAEDMDGFGVVDHEAVGASYLSERGFSPKIAELVKSHVEAKRYLCAVNQRYYNNLSHASKMTLQFQGGPMNEAEVTAFEQNPLKNLIIKMRTWDEEAKYENIPLLDFDSLQARMVNHLTRN